jgi:hypothetical protein
MNTTASDGHRQLWRWVEQLATVFVCLDARLMGAYQVTLAELAAEGWSDPRPVRHDAEVSIADAREVAAGAVA